MAVVGFDTDELQELAAQVAPLVALPSLPPVVAGSSDRLNVRAFGARGDGVTDDTAAFNAALRTPRAGLVYVPPGVYRITGPVAFQPPLHLAGAGPEISILKSTGTGYSPIDVNASGFYGGAPAHISGVTVCTTVENPNPAISVKFPDLGFGVSINEEAAIVRDVTIRPEPTVGRASFGVGLDLRDCWNAIIDNVTIHGDNTVAGMQAGIRLRGNALDVNISNFRIMNAAVGIEVLDRAEGTLISKGWIIANAPGTTGIRFATRPGTASEPNKPWGAITDVHIATYSYGILLFNHPQCSISGCLIYRHGTTPTYRGIWIEGDGVGAGGTSIIGNKLIAMQPSKDDGGIVIASHLCTVTGNIIMGFRQTAIWLSDKSAQCVVVGNAVPTADIWNAGGAANVVANNL